MKIRPFFAWYDLWIGFYIQREPPVIYFCPLPMMGLKVELKRRWDPRHDT